MTTLTVGQGEQYATIAAAVAAAQDGDVVDVDAGTYTNDFATVEKPITIQGIGGMLRMVATLSPPNGKAILTTEADATIVNVGFSGAAVDEHNGAGIRVDFGNLVLVSDSFTGNQEGVLEGPPATPDSGPMDIYSSQFGFNGADDGLSHNLYVGAIGTLTISDSYFHDAVGGHEVKSRAEITTITNSRIIDGDTQTEGGYDVDLPNGGVATLSGDVIEKGSLEPNGAMIHYGGEAAPYPGSTPTVTGDLLVNNAGTDTLPRVIFNDDGTGSGGTAILRGNTIYNVDPANLIQGEGISGGNTLLTGSPSLDTSSPMLRLAEIEVSVPIGGVMANAGAAIDPFAGINLLVVNDAMVSLTLGSWRNGVLAYKGSANSLSVVSGTGTLTITGAASAIAASLGGGQFTYTANAGSSGDMIVATLPEPSLFLTLAAGAAATAGASFSETISVAACYRAGTMIATPSGERDVAVLEVGDPVVTASGAVRAIRWVGRRSYAAAMVARHPHLQPIRLAAGALGENCPRRDLLVSPRHAMFVGGVLVPAEALIDGLMITRCAAAEDVSHVHVELDTHDILLAEGAASESYCDCDNRWMFHNGAEAVAQAVSAASWAYCAPVVEAGPPLAAIRARLAAMAAARLSRPMLRTDAGWVTAEHAADGALVFRLDAVPRTLRLVSPCFVPAECAASPDRRTLGIAVRRIAFSAAGMTVLIEPDCALLCDGFHDPESGWRWTNGDAALPVALLSGLPGPATVTVEATGATVAHGREYQLDEAAGLSDRR